MPTWAHDGIRAVYFDAVGTLIEPDPPPAAVYAEAARLQGLTPDPAAVHARFVAAFRAEEAADRAFGWKTDDAREFDRWRRIVTAALPCVPDPDAAFRHLFDHFARPAAWRVAPHAGLVVETLARRGVRVGVASNFDGRLRAVAAGLPELAPVEPFLVISSEVGWRKPAGEFFAAVGRAAGCRPGEILLVGDDLGNDYEGAAAAGLESVLIDPTGRHASVSRRVGSLRELVA